MKPKPFKMPSFVRITFQVKYKVQLVHGFEDPAQEGECCQITRTISVKRKMGPKKKEEVLWHEIMHAIVFENKWKMCDELEETLISNVDRAFAKVMRLNNLRFSW